MQQWKWLAALTWTLVAAFFVVCCWPAPDSADRIGPAAYHRIVPGMQRVEVWKTITFQRPGDHHNPPLGRP